MFRNVQLYRLPEQWGMTPERMSEQMVRMLFQPCGQMDLETKGFVAPISDSDLVHAVNGQWLICLCIEQRILPPAVIKQEAEYRAQELEEQQGFAPGRKQMKTIKQAVLDELTPRAFTRRKHMLAWIDPVAGWLAIDASTRTAAEPMIECLHKAMDELPLKLLRVNLIPSEVMTNWLSNGEAADGLTIDRDCELRTQDEESSVRYVHHTLDGEDVHEHLATGKKVCKLALTFDDKVSFILTEKLELKRVTLLDVEAGEATTREEQFDADFLLMTGQLSRLIPSLIDALGGEEKIYDEGDLVEQAKAPIEQDELYEKAVQIVLAHNRASISLVQRHLMIGYNRSARLIEQMEKSGVVSVANATGVREVLAKAA